MDLSLIQKGVLVLCSQEGAGSTPILMVNLQVLPRKEHKFSGMVLDEKLTFIPHIKHLKQKCLQTMNILKVFSYCCYGADEQLLLRVFTSLVGSRVDDRNAVYGSACKTASKMLDPVLRLGLCLPYGAFRMSPVESV